jgi:hypothetical protein
MYPANDVGVADSMSGSKNQLAGTPVAAMSAATVLNLGSSISPRISL